MLFARDRTIRLVCTQRKPMRITAAASKKIRTRYHVDLDIKKTGPSASFEIALVSCNKEADKIYHN